MLTLNLNCEEVPGSETATTVTIKCSWEAVTNASEYIWKLSWGTSEVVSGSITGTSFEAPLMKGSYSIHVIALNSEDIEIAEGDKSFIVIEDIMKGYTNPRSLSIRPSE